MKSPASAAARSAMFSPGLFSRRRFLKSSLIGGGACCGWSAWGKDLANGHDRFGGWTKKKFTATGFFRTEHDGNRWWLVTPDGHAFISWGVNHYHGGWWAQDYNIDYWLKRFGAQRFNDSAWREGFREAALAGLRRLGLNTLGIHNNARLFMHPSGRTGFPFVAPYEPLVLSHYRQPQAEAYMDIFAAEYETTCELTAREAAAPYRDDPMVLGYCMADCPPLTDNEAAWKGTTTWPRRLRNLDAQAAGKQAYVDCMRDRYGEIAGLNQTYGTQFASWQKLRETADWRPDQAPVNQAERADNAAFLLRCVDRYYAVAKAALLRADPHHLFLGDKINGDTDGVDAIIDVTSRYTDFVNIQCYARWPEQRDMMDRWSAKVGQPFLNGDGAYASPTATMPHPHGRHAHDMAERAAWTREFMENATKRPDFVGWHMCGIIDTSKDMPGKETRQHQGLMTTHGEFYPEMENAVRDISDRLYDLASA